jgi:hypothetical protein
MPIQAGSYSVLLNNANVAFWPLAPGTTVDGAIDGDQRTPFLPESTKTPRPSIGIFDIVIQMSRDDIVTREVAEPTPSLASRRCRAGTEVQNMPLLWEGDGSTRRSRICFAVMVPELVVPRLQGFHGTLRLSASYVNASGRAVARHLEVGLHVGLRERADDMFIFYIVHLLPPQQHCWVSLRAVEARAPSVGVAGASVQAMVLRDNLNNGFTGRNRQVELTTDANGAVSFEGRSKLVLPINWPLVFRASVPERTGGAGINYVRRTHMFRLTAANLPGNTQDNPVQLERLPMRRRADVDLSGRRFLLDPGHGVVYALTTSRRSQEWYGAHLVADRVAEILQERHRVPEENIFWTRTAGFGLIEPDSVRTVAAPETGAMCYEFDLVRRRVRIRNTNRGMRDLSNLLLTRHTGNTHMAQAVPAEERTRLLDLNATTVNAIVARLNQQQRGSNTRVQQGSVRWDVAQGNYVYTQEPIQVPAGRRAVTHVLPFPISTQDWFNIDDGMLEALADRSARWSLDCEIGGDANFQSAARDAMRTSGFLDYARGKILRYLNVTAPHVYLNHGIQGWGPNPRIRYINGLDPQCDLYLSLHLNAGAASSKGQMLLVSRTDPPQDQIRLAKVFTKYLDPLGLGTRQGGIVVEEPNNPAAMLSAQNQRRTRYVYFELEFMNASHSSGAQRQYRYSELLQQACINETAEQIIAAIIESLLERQPNLDAVTYRSQIGSPPLW